MFQFIDQINSIALLSGIIAGEVAALVGISIYLWRHR